MLYNSGGITMKRLPILLVSLLTACLPLYQQKIWEAHPPDGEPAGSFPGITSPYLVAAPEGAMPGDRWPDHPMKILIIHGMGDQELGYAADTITKLSKRLGLHKVTEADPFQIRRPGFPSADYGSVSVEWYSDGRDTFIFYSVLWSPLTRAFEKKYVDFDWSGPTHGRVWADRKLKRHLIDQSFTDAFLYAGAFHEHMQYSVRQGLCLMMTRAESLDVDCDWNDLAPPAEVFVITHSLGSILLLETLGAMVDAEGAEGHAAEELINQARVVALLANQLPLFRLARLEQPEPQRAQLPFDEQMNRLFRTRAKNPNVDFLPFVAFSDPNDLLSFPVPDDWKETLFPNSGLAEHARFINVALNNTWPIAGVVALPSSAHTGYWTNDWVIELLVNGSAGSRRRLRGAG